MSLIKLHTLHPRSFLVSATVLLYFALTTICVAQCPNEIAGFDYIGEINDHQYYISQIEVRWQNANDIALANGGYLAAITSAEENAFILEGALDINAGPSAHIGLNDYVNEGNLVWSSGESLFFYNVNPNPPNSIDNNNASINLWINGGGWSLKSIWAKEKFIMELPCNEQIPDSQVEILSHSCPAEFPTPGSLINFTVTVQNLDSAPSLPQTFGFYQSLTSEDPLADILIGQADIGILAPNEVGVISFVNVPMPDPFYFPSFSMNATQWGSFYVKKYSNITGTSLEIDASNQLFDIFCQKYTTDISVDITNASFEYGDEGIVSYEGEISNNGPATAYNVKAIVGRNAHGSIPSITSNPYQNILTYDDTDQTKVICIDELGVGETIALNVFYDFNPTFPDTLPASFDVSIVAYSEHLIDPVSNNNSIEATFLFNADVSDDCPDEISGYNYLGQYNSNRYFISELSVHWWEADSFAIEAGGVLTSIETEFENSFLYGYLAENAWIGMSDFEEEGNFVWSNGEEVDFVNHQEHNGPLLDYISINHWNGIWVNNKGLVKHKFVIEVPCNEEPGSFVDLTGDNLVLTTSTAAQLETAGFTFDLINNGNSDAANAFDIRVYLSSDTVLSDDDAEVGLIPTGFWGSEYNENVMAGDGIAIPWNLLLGEYYVILAIDREANGSDNIIESDESNNNIVSEETLLVTGNACTILPTVDEGDMTVYGIPQGNSVFILYGPADEIVTMYTCSYDCPDELKVYDLVDGDYQIAFYYFNADWTLNCQAWPLYFSIVLGEINGMPDGNETELGTDISFDPYAFVAVKNNALYPNPANDYMITTIESQFDRTAQLIIYDINGRLMLEKKVQLSKGIKPIELDVSNLANGLHHLVIKSENNIHSTQRFIKN